MPICFGTTSPCILEPTRHALHQPRTQWFLDLDLGPGKRIFVDGVDQAVERRCPAVRGHLVQQVQRVVVLGRQQPNPLPIQRFRHQRAEDGLVQENLVQLATAGAGLKRLVGDHRFEICPPGAAQARGRIEGKAVGVKVGPEYLPVYERLDGVGHLVNPQRPVDPLPEVIGRFVGRRADVLVVDRPERSVGRRPAGRRAEVEQDGWIDDQAVEAQPDERANLRSGHLFGPGAGVHLFGKGVGRAALLDGQEKPVKPLDAGQGVRGAVRIEQEGPNRAIAQRPAKGAQALDDDPGQPLTRLGTEQDEKACFVRGAPCLFYFLTSDPLCLVVTNTAQPLHDFRQPSRDLEIGHNYQVLLLPVGIRLDIHYRRPIIRVKSSHP